MKLETQNNYVSNPQFVGGVEVAPVSGSEFDNADADNPQFGFVAGGLYVGSIGDVTLKAVDNSVFTLVSASGFIPGIVTAISASSSATDIIALR